MSDAQVLADEVNEQVEVSMGDTPDHVAIEMPPPSFGPIILGAGATLALLGLLQPLLLIVGVPVALYGVWKTANFPEVDMHPHFFTFLNDRKLGMWVFLASEVMFFSSLIGAFIAFKIDQGFEEAEEILSLPLATVGTSVLIISSFAVVMGLEAMQSGDRRVFFNWMIVTAVLGITFVSIQAFEWYELMHENITAETLFGTAFYVTTGFHGMHVLGGVGWLILLLIKARRGDYAPDNTLGIELFGLYWHFVDVVWIVLFTVIYLIH